MHATYPLSALTTELPPGLGDNQLEGILQASELAIALLDVPLNTPVEITGFADGDIELNVCRMGLAIGTVLSISSRITGGPLVVVSESTELALGRQVCKGIHVMAKKPELTLGIKNQAGV